MIAGMACGGGPVMGSIGPFSLSTCSGCGTGKSKIEGECGGRGPKVGRWGLEAGGGGGSLDGPGGGGRGSDESPGGGGGGSDEGPGGGGNSLPK